MNEERELLALTLDAAVLVCRNVTLEVGQYPRLAAGPYLSVTVTDWPPAIPS